MTDIIQPRLSYALTGTQNAISNNDQRILVVAQLLPAGSATAGALVEDIANGGAEDGLFGAKSMIAALVRAIKVRNQQIAIDAIGLADAGGGTAADGELVFAGTATEDGSYEIIAGSEYSHKYTIAVTSGDTATVIGDAVEAAITADTKVQVTASNTTGTVAITADNAGTFGNSIPLEIRGTVAGITTSVTAMSSGATDPTLTSVFDVVGNKRYQGIVWGYPSDTAVVRSFLDGRFPVDGRVLDGVAFTAINDSVANLSTLGSGLNSQSLVMIGGKLETETNYKGGDIVELPLVKAAAFAGYRALRLDSNGYNISDLVISTNGPLDAFGGSALASKPYFNTPFARLLPIKTARGFTDTEIESLTDDGITVIGNNVAGNGVIAGEVVTTYKTDSAGNSDVTFKYLNYVDTASQTREYRFNNYRSRFAQSRLTNGDLVLNYDMANSQSIRSFSKRLYNDLSKLVLVEAGETALNFFVESLVVSIDKSLGKVTLSWKDIIVTQMREIAITQQIAFSANG